MTAAIAASLFAGGALGASVFNTASSGAATTTTTTATATPSASTQGAPPAGVFKSNENAEHEADESATREAEETAGKFPKTYP
jgi:hypothetical protein